MPQQFAHGFAIAPCLNAARRKRMAQGMKANVRQIVSCKETIIKLTKVA